MSYPIASQLRYGPTLDTLVDVTFPLGIDSVKTWRRAQPGSESSRYPGGVDTWVTGYDYVMQARLRWLTQPAWSAGGLGTQGFLDWAGAGNAFRFIPDRSNPNFYVDNCFLDDPAFTDPQPDIEQGLAAQAITITMRNTTADFMTALRGLMFEYVPGTSLTDPVAASYSRAGGAVATYIDRTGKVATAASGVLRDAHYETGVRSTLLENPGATNLLLQSEDGTTTWVPGPSGCTVTANVTTAPDGSTSADDLNFLTTSSNNYLHQLVTIANPASRTYVVSFWQSDGSLTYAGNQVVIMMRRGDGTQQLSFSSSSGLKVANTLVVNGVTWRRLYCVYQADATTPANLDIYLRNNTLTGNYRAWGMMLEDTTSQTTNATVPSSYVKTTTAAVARSGDVLNFPYGALPQPMWVYLKYVERGTGYLTNGVTAWRLFEIGNVAGAAPRLIIYQNGIATAQRVLHLENGASVVTVTDGVQAALGDTVEVLGIVRSDGSLQLIRSINGAADTVIGTSGTSIIPSAWAGPTIVSMNLQQGGIAAYQTVRVGAGTTVTTLAQARAA